MLFGKSVPHEELLDGLAKAIEDADAIVVGAGAGLSTSAGFTYAGERFERLFGDFIDAYGFADMYSAGFYPYSTPEETWGFWSRYIWCNRYTDAPKDTYAKLLALICDKDFFVITTNVDHQFQKAGFPKDRLFYTQGDYGLWQCSLPCHAKTYPNEPQIREMAARQRTMRVPASLVPHCPVCGRGMSMNLRADDTFVEDDGWRAAAARYRDFLARTERARTLFLDLGSGWNTPGVFKFPFWQMTLTRPTARYAWLDHSPDPLPAALAPLSLHLRADIGATLAALRESIDRQ